MSFLKDCNYGNRKQVMGTFAKHFYNRNCKDMSKGRYSNLTGNLFKDTWVLNSFFSPRRCVTTLKRALQHAKDTKGGVACRLCAKQVKGNFPFSPPVLFSPRILVGSWSFIALESEKWDSCYPKDFISFKN